MFKVNDKVKAFGCEGVVTEISLTYTNPVIVKFGSQYVNFFKDGREYLWHKEPSLVLVERAKTKVKPKLYRCKRNFWSTCIDENDEPVEHFVHKDTMICTSEEPNTDYWELLTDDHHAVEVEE